MRRTRHFICVEVGDDWQPLHWVEPVSLRDGRLRSVCGLVSRDTDRDRIRYLERSKVDQLKCGACLRAFREQASKNQRKRRL